MKKLLHSFLFMFLTQFCFAQNYGIQVDGLSGSVTLCHDDNFNIGTGFTVEAWIFANEWKTEFWQGSILNKDQHPAGLDPAGFSLRAGKDGTLSFVMGTTEQWPEVISDPIMNINQWYHVAAVYDNDNATLFINGEIVEVAPIMGTPNFNTLPLTIGDSPGFPGRFFDGVIDEVRVWNIARTPQEISDNQTVDLIGTEPGLVAYLPMNDGMGTTPLNIADGNCGGSFNGAVSWVDGYSIPAFDVGVSSLVAPDVLSIFERPVKIQVTLQNYGSNPISNVPIDLNINGLPSISETYMGTIPIGETVTYSFVTPLDLTSNTTNLVGASTSHPDDTNGLNDGISYRYKSPDNGNIVNILNEEQHNFAGAGQTKFTLVNLPENMEDYEQLLLHFDVECPSGGCDPWDQTARFSIDLPDGEVEIARYITPYGIECGPWTVDVTDFKSIMTGNTVFKSYVQVFGPNGWLVNCDLEFIEGSAPAHQKLNRLWENDYLVYGDPGISHDLPVVSTDIANQTESSHLRMTITGHGQGNTDGAAEFSNKTHQVMVNGNMEASHNLWKDDCAQNICANQGGNWMPNRAGWCPGQEVTPLIFNLTNLMTPGQSIEMDYVLEDYTNLLNTGYNNGSHTEPHYKIFSYIVEQSDSRYEMYNNLKAENVELLNDGTNFTGINFSIKNTGSEDISGAMVSYYADDVFVFEEPLSGTVAAGATVVHSFSQVTLSLSEDKLYAVVSSSADENISDDVILEEIDFSISVKELTKEELNIFPNPSSGTFQVEVSETLLNTEMEIIDAQGRVVRRMLLNQTNLSFDLEVKGIYAISVNTDEGKALFGKIIVQ